MGDPAATEPVRQAYEEARGNLATAHAEVADHQREIDAHHADGSVDAPYDPGPWDAEAEAAELRNEQQAEAEAQRAFDVARDDFRRVDPEAFAATAKADL